MGNEIVKGALYLVATPIGNLGDLSPRAKHILEFCGCRGHTRFGQVAFLFFHIQAYDQLL
jgi:hypothetical protein